MKNGFPKLKPDTWAIVGAFGACSAFIVTAIVTVILTLHSVTNARIDALGAQIESQGARIDARIESQGARIDARIESQGARIDALDARIDMLGDTMRDEHTAMRNEHALILESLARVAQRVSYIEGHLGIGGADDPESAGVP